MFSLHYVFMYYYYSSENSFLAQHYRRCRHQHQHRPSTTTTTTTTTSVPFSDGGEVTSSKDDDANETIRLTHTTLPFALFQLFPLFYRDPELE